MSIFCYNGKGPYIKFGLEWPCFYTRFYRNQLFIGVMLKSCSKNQNSHPTKHLSLFGLQVYRNGLQHGCFSEIFVRNYHTSFWQNSSVNYFWFTDIECSKQWIFGSCIWTRNRLDCARCLFGTGVIKVIVSYLKRTN